MKKFLLFLATLYGSSGCDLGDGNKLPPMECLGNCDSVHKVVHSDKEYGFYQMYKGRFVGEFLELKGKDTVYGKIEDYGILRKTMIYYPGGRSKIRISYYRDSKEVTSELIFFKEGVKDLINSHFIRVHRSGDSVFFIPFTRWNNVDSIVVEMRDSIFQPQMKSDTAYVLLSSGFDFDDGYLILLERDSLIENSFKGSKFKLSNNRVYNSNLFEGLKN